MPASTRRMAQGVAAEVAEAAHSVRLTLVALVSGAACSAAVLEALAVAILRVTPRDKDLFLVRKVSSL